MKNKGRMRLFDKEEVERKRENGREKGREKLTVTVTPHYSKLITLVRASCLTMTKHEGCR
jgi:hypothetical protein